MITIRPATTDDEPFLWEMLAQAIYIGPDQPAVPLHVVRRNPELSRYVANWGRPGDFGVIAESGSTPIGAAWARVLPADEPGYGFIDEATPELTIAILPGFRGKGIGSRLLEALLDMAAETYHAISLSVTRENPARRLYRRFGFIAVAETITTVTMVHRF